MSAPETTCSPPHAWALLKRGMTIRQIATRYGDLPRDLDASIWAWRAAVTGSVKPPALSTAQAMAVRDFNRSTPRKQKALV